MSSGSSRSASTVPQWRAIDANVAGTHVNDYDGLGATRVLREVPNDRTDGVAASVCRRLQPSADTALEQGGSLNPHDAIDPDIDLVARVGRGEGHAARTLVSRKLPRLLALAQRMLGDRSEAEDVAQECMLRVWQRASAWRPGVARFDTWLHQVALNLCHDRLRMRRRTHPDAEVPDRIDPDPLPEQRIAADERGKRVEEALHALPERQREAIVLQHFQGLSNQEAAAAMEISVEALESLLSRARRNLRQQLLEEERET
ncbi:RNA polymerase sigma factor [Dokdonella sp.]|nr:RNA polymerase sigma factor [Dokdonella sp.]